MSRSVFRRRKKDEPSSPQDEVELDEGTLEDEDAGDDGTGDDAPTPAPAVLTRPRGPWDESDVPADGPERLDLGGLRVPVPPDTEVRVDVSPEGEVVAATLVREGSAMQVSAFAAPRSEGIWHEVRAEIAEALTGSGGQAQDATGPWGAELHARVPTEVPERGVVLQPARFIGVDGPRWFLRALITGPAAVGANTGALLEAALREVVVVRGTDPMAVRDALPLRLPREVVEQQQAAQAQADAEAEARTPLPPPERGPEITEIR